MDVFYWSAQIMYTLALFQIKPIMLEARLWIDYIQERRKRGTPLSGPMASGSITSEESPSTNAGKFVTVIIHSINFSFRHADDTKKFRFAFDTFFFPFSY